MRTAQKKFKIIAIIIGFLLLFSLNFFRAGIRDFFYLISSPLQKKFWNKAQETAGFLKAMVEFKKLKEENEKIKLENQKLLVEISNLNEVKKENEFLRNALKMGLEKEFRLDLTEVISKDVGSDLLLINKGRKDGITKDLPVITEQKILVGRVGEVYENFSKVILSTSKESSFSGEIIDKEIYGLVKGKGNFKLSFELLPLDKEIKDGDVVVTSILGGVFPKGLLVGQIKKVEKSDIETFQRAEIEPAFQIPQLKLLFVIKQW